MHTDELQRNLEALVSRYRGTQAKPTPGEVEQLYTDGCAEVLRRHAQLLRLKRRLIAAEADSHLNVAAAREAAELRRLRDEATDDLDAISALVRVLRTAVDWTSASADEQAA